MTRHKRIGKMIWWGLLVLWVLCMGAGLVYLFSVSIWTIGLIGTPSLFFYYIFEDLGSSYEVIPVFPIYIYSVAFSFFKKTLEYKNTKNGKADEKSRLRRCIFGISFDHGVYIFHM